MYLRPVGGTIRAYSILLRGIGWCWTLVLILDVAQFMDDAVGFLAEYHRVSFVHEPFFHFLLLVFGPFDLHPSRLHREQLLQF